MKDKDDILKEEILGLLQTHKYIRPVNLEKAAEEIVEIYKSGRDDSDESSAKYLKDNRLREIPRKKGIFHPESEQQIKDLIKVARENHATIRVIGSGHSTREAIFAHNNNHINLKLGGRLRQIRSIKPEASGEFATVIVGAGCHLGIDPSDKESSRDNAFNIQVDNAGFALPILGGMSHQTIAGALQTSTAGGSIVHSLGDVLEEIKFIDGTGILQVCKKGTDEFNAAVVSMGLFGILTEVTLRLPKKYLIWGHEVNYELKDSFLAKDEKGQHTKLHNALFGEHEYVHMNWFPQKYVQRTIQWTGKRVDKNTDNLPEYKHPLKSPFENFLAATLLKFIDFLIYYLGGDDDLIQVVIGELITSFVVSISGQDEQKKGFCDKWYIALPNDDQADIDHLIKTSFTEIWFPQDQYVIDEVMKRLEELFDRHPKAAGNFAVEFYSAKKSDFWLSPACEGNVFRVDPYWWDYNFGDPREFFANFWDRLLTIKDKDGKYCARLHWGKYMPDPDIHYGEFTFREHLHARYGRLNAWLTLREKYDPDQLFVTDYWRQLFAILPKLSMKKVEDNNNKDSKQEETELKKNVSAELLVKNNFLKKRNTSQVIVINGFSANSESKSGEKHNFKIPSSTYIETLHIAGSFNDWLQAKDAKINRDSETAKQWELKPNSFGEWELYKSLEKVGKHEYKFVINGNIWYPQGTGNNLVHEVRAESASLVEHKM